MPQGRLAQVLRGLQSRVDERLLVGPESFDDAGVFVLGEREGLSPSQHVALVQTVDFFPPIVDDPYFYGAIAAANSLSDVYAMGGRPLTALTLASIPKEFPPEWTAEIFRGGFDKIVEAGAVVAGGHTVESAIQFGFSITGVVDPNFMTANSGAKLGDLVYLTKPLGMGSMTTAAKQKKITWEVLEPAARQMATLNDRACAAMLAAHAHACTDITGFGLVGHARNVAKASRVTIELTLSDAPIFPGAYELAKAGVLTGASKRGRIGLKDEVAIAAGLDETRVAMVFDAETSGGLLIVVAPNEAATLERELASRQVLVQRVGRVVEPRGVHVALV